MRKILAVTALAAALIAPAAAGAQPSLSTFNTSNISTALGNGGYIGTASLSGFSGPFKIFCTDQNNSITLGNSYAVWVTPLWNNSDMSKTRLGTKTFALAAYRANASFASMIAVPIDDADRTRQTDMWFNAETATSAAQLRGNTSFDATGWYVITAVGAAGIDDDNLMQEQLGFSPVPEPSTYALLASGLLGIAGIARRRRAQQA